MSLRKWGELNIIIIEGGKKEWRSSDEVSINL